MIDRFDRVESYYRSICANYRYIREQMNYADEDGNIDVSDKLFDESMTVAHKMGTVIKTLELLGLTEEVERLKALRKGLV